MAAAYVATMRRDRERLGLRECRAAWLLGLTVREYRILESGEDPSLVFRVWERMVEVFQWPKSFASGSSVGEAYGRDSVV